jgi:hypothetical protein
MADLELFHGIYFLVTFINLVQGFILVDVNLLGFVPYLSVRGDG